MRRTKHRFRNHYRAFMDGKPAGFASVQNPISGEQVTILIPCHKMKKEPVFIHAHTLKCKHRLQVIVNRTRSYYTKHSSQKPAITVERIG